MESKLRLKKETYISKNEWSMARKSIIPIAEHIIKIEQVY